MSGDEGKRYDRGMWLHPAWFALQHQCHLNRQTAMTVRAAGFHIQETSIHGWGILQIIKAASNSNFTSPGE